MREDDAFRLALRPRCVEDNQRIMRLHRLDHGAGEPERPADEPEFVCDAKLRAQVFEIENLYVAESIYNIYELGFLQKRARCEDYFDPGAAAGALHALGSGGVIQHCRNAPHGGHAKQKINRGVHVGHQYAHEFAIGSEFAGEPPQCQASLQHVFVGGRFLVDVLEHHAALAV